MASAVGVARVDEAPSGDGLRISGDVAARGGRMKAAIRGEVLGCGGTCASANVVVASIHRRGDGRNDSAHCIRSIFGMRRIARSKRTRQADASRPMMSAADRAPHRLVADLDQFCGAMEIERRAVSEPR